MLSAQIGGARTDSGRHARMRSPAWNRKIRRRRPSANGARARRMNKVAPTARVGRRRLGNRPPSRRLGLGRLLMSTTYRARTTIDRVEGLTRVAVRDEPHDPGANDVESTSMRNRSLFNGPVRLVDAKGRSCRRPRVRSACTTEPTHVRHYGEQAGPIARVRGLDRGIQRTRAAPVWERPAIFA